MTKRPRAILFDLDDTILDDTGARGVAWREACALTAGELPGVFDVDAAVGAIQAYNEVFWADPDRHRAGRADMRAARRQIAAGGLRALGVDVAEVAAAIGDVCHRLRLEAIAPLPGAIATLERLRAGGVALGLVTNGGRRGQRDKVERFDLARFFGVIAIEGELGFGKPDPRAFHHALDALGCAPEEAWMVGDSLVYDIAGAQAVGVTAVWVDAAGDGAGSHPVQPDHVIRRISELP